MTAPFKPWESYSRNDLNSNNQKYIPEQNLTRMHQVNNSQYPPPLPPRPSQFSNISSVSTLNNLPFNYNSFGSYGGNYNNYGGNYGYHGYNQNFGTNFGHQIDFGSHQAFQSIESVVRAFGSVAMLLDSTFQAVFNSFRAIIGVADHFSRMKLQFSQIISSLAVLRTLRWIWLKIKKLFGSESDDLIWKKSSQEIGNAILNVSNGQKNWPLFLFFIIIFGGPWILWKLLSSFTQTASWACGESEHYIAVGDFDFFAESDQELSFKKGTQIILAPKELQPKQRGWLLASVDGKKIGLVPQNYVHVINKQPGSNRPSINLQTKSQPGVIPDLINSNNDNFDDVYNNCDPKVGASLKDYKNDSDFFKPDNKIEKDMQDSS